MDVLKSKPQIFASNFPFSEQLFEILQARSGLGLGGGGGGGGGGNGEEKQRKVFGSFRGLPSPENLQGYR